LFRNLALVGALLLVLAESREDEGRGLFAGLPSVGKGALQLFSIKKLTVFFLGENKPKNYLQLAGRILVVFMFATLLRLEISFMQVINCQISLSD
jgi:ER-derived vesicles protein